MNRIKIILFAILSCGLFAILMAAYLVEAKDVTKDVTQPNIILIMVDDMGYSDLGCFGSEINTLNIDKLASDGIKFTQFTNCAKCETSRRTLMSGHYHTEVNIDKAGITIPEHLALGGYQNFMVGKWHHLDTPIKRGFDRFFGFLVRLNSKGVGSDRPGV